MKTITVITGLSFGSGPIVALRLLAFAAVTWLLVAAYRWIYRQSCLLAVLFVGGIVARATAGVALFAISFFRMPVFTNLQLGDGFWKLALDGRRYYDLAAHAVAAGFGTITDASPSPLYIRALAAWMWVFGVSPAGAVLLNVVCYAASAVLIVMCADLHRAGRAPRPTGAGVALFGLTFSPALLIFGTQPLKDPLCTMFIIFVISGARIWWLGLNGGTARNFRLVGSGTLLMAVGIYCVAGIRAYVAVFEITALAAAAAYSVVFFSDARPRWGAALLHAALLTVLWFLFVTGAGPYAEPYQLRSFVGGRATSVAMLDSARSGFVATGGATSLEEDDALLVGDAAKPESGLGRVERLGRGYAALFIPISALRAASIVKFKGGAGLLEITDIDTIVADLTVLAALCLFVISVRGRGLSPGPMFVLVLAILLTGALAYVVTNYGTLFRLRLLGVTPLWMLPVMIPTARAGRKTELELT